jgi:1,4-alpha-glucan branching enzyme
MTINIIFSYKEQNMKPAKHIKWYSKSQKGQISSVLFFLILSISTLSAQTLDVTFRYMERPSDTFLRVYVPGTMPDVDALDWGPNNNGIISVSAPSQMIYDASVFSYVRTYPLEMGVEHEYKIHYHYNSTGSENAWIPDPYNPLMTTDGWQNSLITAQDPLFFQPSRHLNETGLVDAMSVGIFTNSTISAILAIVAGDTVSALSFHRTDGIFHYPVEPAQSLYESYEVLAVIDGDTLQVYHQPAIVINIAPVPDGLTYGQNISSSGVTNLIYAPAQSVVLALITQAGVVGETSAAIPMNRASETSDIWWMQSNLSAGDYDLEYVLIDGRRISDPYSVEVINDRTRFHIGATPFTWTDQEFERPAKDTMIIYELHLDDYAAMGSGNGRFSHLINRLDHLQSLGINAIELMPVMEFPGERSWGYNPTHYGAVESTYGTPDEFKALVNEAHNRGISILLDVVWNHVNSSGPLWQIQPNFALNPYCKDWTDLRPNETQNSYGMIDLDHFTDEMQEHVRIIQQRWIEEFHVDGYRYDFTRGIGWDMAQPDYGILGWVTAMNNFDPSLMQIAEHLPADPYLIANSQLDAGWHDSFRDRLYDEAYSPISLETMREQVIKLREYSNTGSSYSNRTQAIKSIVTHDEQSLIMEMVQWGGVPLTIALQRDKLYSAMTFTSLGVPMMWQGQELGMKSGWVGGDNDKLSYRPMDWSLLDTERGQSHLALYKQLITLRKHNPAMWRGAYQDLWRYTTERVIVWGFNDTFFSGRGDQVTIIANFSGSSQTVQNVPFMSAGDWHNYIDPANSLTTADGNYGELTIPAYGMMIFTNYIYPNDAQKSIQNPNSFELKGLYPNPFNQSIAIEYNIPSEALSLRLDIYNLRGEIVYSKSENTNFRNKKIMWKGLDLYGNSVPSGLYFVVSEIETMQGNSKMTSKITLLK